MKNLNKHILRIGLTVLLMIGVLIAFWFFIRRNEERIRLQNEEYLNELTVQRAISVNSLIEENMTFIHSTAYLYGRSLSSPWADVAVIRDFEENSVFDRLRFIDASGDNYTSKGVMSNLADRDYFQAGMRGESGVTYVAQSRVTGEKQIGFYAPVYYEDEILGVMVGFYGEDYVQKLLSYELFGYSGEGWLCDRSGAVLGATQSDESDNYLTWLEDTGRCTDEELVQIGQALKTGENTAFSYSEDGIAATGYIAGLEQNGWVLIRTFPPAASRQIVANANRAGIALLAALLVMFGIYALILAVGVIMENRRTREANRNANDISTGVSRMFEKFVTLDLRTMEYCYISGSPDTAQMPERGSYEEFCRSFLAIIPEKDEQEKVADFIQPSQLAGRLRVSDSAGIRVHTQMEKDQWFTYNFIVIERSGEEPVRILVSRQDATELFLREMQEQRRLSAALEAAESANRAKTEFLFNMSHDIRTPMNAIMGFTGIAQTHLDDRERVKDSLEKIETASRHLLSLINDVLDMSRIESGKLQLNLEEFSVTESLQNLLDMVGSQAKARGQTLTSEISAAHPDITGDPLRLNQVLLNILSNAVKYTPEGGHISVRLRELPFETEGFGLYEFTVTDDGIGMSKEYLPHLFEHFTREQSSTISKIQGTGLGMSIAKRLVDLMGGSIHVSSELGRGSEFTVLVPAAHAAAPAKETTAAGEPVCRPEDLKGIVLLLVEDNPINAEIARMILEEAGFTVDWVENGKLAAEKMAAEHDRYRAVLMDVQMPVMNGYEASRVIRRDEKEHGLPRIPIIAMTANTFEDDRRNAFEAGMDAHIAKPYDQEAMLRIVAGYALHGAEQTCK